MIIIIHIIVSIIFIVVNTIAPLPGPEEPSGSTHTCLVSPPDTQQPPLLYLYLMFGNISLQQQQKQTKNNNKKTPQNFIEKNKTSQWSQIELQPNLNVTCCSAWNINSIDSILFLFFFAFGEFCFLTETQNPPKMEREKKPTAKKLLGSRRV